MIHVSDLVKIFPDRKERVYAVNDVTFTVEDGQFYTLLGPSGCGKTTTLRCIAGLEKPDAGDIEVGGVVVCSTASRTYVPAHKRDIGMVFQSYAIWPHMTVFENAAFPLRVGQKKYSGDEIKRKVMDAAHRRAGRPGGPHGDTALGRPAAAPGARPRPRPRAARAAARRAAVEP